MSNADELASSGWPEGWNPLGTVEDGGMVFIAREGSPISANVGRLVHEAIEVRIAPLVPPDHHVPDPLAELTSYLYGVTPAARDPRDTSNIDEALRCVNWGVCGNEDLGSGWCSDACHRAYLLGIARKDPVMEGGEVATIRENIEATTAIGFPLPPAALTVPIEDEPRFAVAARRLHEMIPRLSNVHTRWSSNTDEYLWYFLFADAPRLELILDRATFAVLDADQLAYVFNGSIQAHLVDFEPGARRYILP
jgi:hypothetical protein